MLPEIVLLDDDEFVCSHWELRCRTGDRKIRTFRRGRDLLHSIDGIHPSTQMFIDKNLNEKPDGVSVAKKLYQKGFYQVYLSTAEDPRLQPPVRWVRGVIGKTPPFWLFNGSSTTPITQAERQNLISKMTPKQFALYNERITHFLEVANGLDSGCFPGPDLNGFCIPEIVMNAWERAITFNLTDEEIKFFTDHAWQLV